MTVAVDLAPRVASFDVDEHPIPTRHDEAWRFAALAQFQDLMAPVVGAGAVRLSGAVTHASDTAAQLSDRWQPTDRIAAIAAGQASNVVHVQVADDEVVPAPIVIGLAATAPIAYEQVVVTIGRHARAVVVIEQPAQADLVGAIELRIGDGADLTVVVEQLGDAGQRAVLHMPATVGRDASCTLATVAAGGRAVRLVPSVAFAGPGGRASLLGAFLVQGQAHLEQRVFVEHHAPHCTSRVAYKGALSGEGARSVWIGDVLVRSEAIGTDTYEFNRNLLLDDGPRADSVPNLELETGDIVGAGHASATGRFDEEQLFYLQARGIPERVARQLVVRGFFAEVLAAIPDPELRARLDGVISERLGLTPDERQLP